MTTGPRGAFAAAAAVVALTAGVAGLRLTGDDGRPAARPEASPTPSPSPVPSPSPSPAPVVPAFTAPLSPAEVVVLTRDRRLLTLSADTGRVVRTLHRAWPYSAVVRSPDGTRLYYSDDRTERIVEVAPGGAARTVGRGCYPRVSPDGRRIAYATSSGGIAVADLTDPDRPRRLPSYVEQRYAGAPLGVADLAWVRGGRIAVSMTWEGSVGIRVVDPATDRGLGDGVFVDAGAERLDLLAGDLLVTYACCFPEDEDHAVRVRDSDTGRVRTLLRAGTAYAAAADPAGHRRFVYAHAGAVHRWDGAGGRTLLARLDVLALDW